jgi:hypothetical protein
VIRAFVGRVLGRLDAGDPHTARWAGEIARWVPGFPGHPEIAAPDALVETVTACIWGASVVHSTEHHGLVHDVPLAAIPLRLRVPPPFSREVPEVDRRALTTRSDAWRQLLAWDVLVRARPATRLDRVSYDFDDPELRSASAAFLVALREHDQNLTGRRFAPLDRMAVGIQF